LSRHIADSNVLSSHIATSNVLSRHIADSNVLSSHIAASNVLSSHIADSNVLARHIADSNVRLAHLAEVISVPLGGTGLSALPSGEIPFGGAAGGAPLGHGAALRYDASTSNLEAVNVAVEQRAHVRESLLIGEPGGARYRLFVAPGGGSSDGELRLSRINAAGEERFFLNLGDLERLLSTVALYSSVAVLLSGAGAAGGAPYLVDGQAYADYVMRRGVAYTFACANPPTVSFLDAGGAPMDIAAAVLSGAVTLPGGAPDGDGLYRLTVDMGYGRAALETALATAARVTVHLASEPAAAGLLVFRTAP
jgi:hypothetical protein